MILASVINTFWTTLGFCFCNKHLRMCDISQIDQARQITRICKFIRVEPYILELFLLTVSVKEKTKTTFLRRWKSTVIYFPLVQYLVLSITTVRDQPLFTDIHLFFSVARVPSYILPFSFIFVLILKVLAPPKKAIIYVIGPSRACIT